MHIAKIHVSDGSDFSSLHLWLIMNVKLSKCVSLVGSVMGFRDRESGPLLRLPFTH